MKNFVNATGFGWGAGMALVASMVGPFVLWPIERLIPAPVLVEELYKAWLVWLVLGSKPRNGIFWVIGIGLAFGVSETMFYLLNFMQSGDLASWGLRLTTTVPMHMMTMVLQWIGWGMGLGPVGIVPAILAHQWFNSNI